MIARIFIDNYRCFSNFELRPGRVNLLLGPNGGGKSSLFDALDGLVNLTRLAMDVAMAFPEGERTRWDTRTRQRFELDIVGEKGVYRYALIVMHDGDEHRVEREQVTLEGRSLYAFEGGQVHLYKNDGSPLATFPFAGTRSFLAQIDDEEESPDLMWLLDYLDGVCLVRLQVRDIESTSKEEHDQLLDDGSNFASWYRSLLQERPESVQALRASLVALVPGLESLKLVNSGGRGRNRDLVAAMRTAGRSYELDFDDLSDGQRALIVLYTLLHGFDADGCLLLDEPESHVGLPEIQPWLVEMNERFAEAGQVFVISHHPEVIDYLAAGQVVLIERPDGGPARCRTAPFDRDAGVSASQQVAHGLLDA